MKKQINTNHWGLLLLIAVLISFCHGCMTDKVAIQKVLTNKKSFDTVGQVYTQLHPCNPITIVHHSDTSYLYDTSNVYNVDTIGNYIHDTVTITHTNTRYIHDRDTIVDGQQIAILESQIAYDNVKLGELTGKIDATQIQVVSEHSRGNKWELYFWLLLASIVLVVLLVVLKPRI